MQIFVRPVFRATRVTGFPVRNTSGETIGSIEEVVIDLEHNNIAYFALSFGGFLGVGDKLFAIPAKELTLEHDEGQAYFRLDISVEKLKSAPGFDRRDWPDVADERWREEIDRHYRTQEEEGTAATK